MSVAAMVKPQRIVLAHGCWDLLHLGHIRHLQEAKKLGSKLVVSVTGDKFVSKGMGRPHFTAEQRAEALRALECVDEVIINDAPDALELIRGLRPSIYVKGIDYSQSSSELLTEERDAVEAGGGRMHFTTTEKWSSSALINKEKYPPEVRRYLERCKAAGFREKIIAAFNRADFLKIAFVGETIIDEYRYVKGLGRASKELMLATVETGYERFDGGVLAAAKHAEWRNSEVITAKDYIRKTRFVDQDFNRKLFDVYSAQRIELTDEDRQDFRDRLDDAVEFCDVVVVFDFGHGLIGETERGIISKARFSAINAQTNAGNYGFNPVTKYRKADLVCIDVPEARLAVSMDRAPISAVVGQLAERIDCEKFLITKGCMGSTFSDQQVLGDSPAFASGGIDTMGAGDATLAVVGPLIGGGLGIDAGAFLGNVVGSIKTSIIGHRRHVTRDEIVQTVEALLA